MIVVRCHVCGKKLFELTGELALAGPRVVIVCARCGAVNVHPHEHQVAEQPRHELRGKTL